MKSSKDVVEIAIRRQLSAMGAREYVLSVGEHGKMINSHVDAAGVMKSVGWLRAMNAQGKNIYIKPAAPDTDLVLVDDVEYIEIERMIADGLRPAVAVETSPDNYQAWIKVGEALDSEMRRAVASVLAREYSGDLRAVSRSQPGRLAGFTNRKDKHMNTRTGAYPWVTLLHWSGHVIGAGVRDGLLARAAVVAVDDEVSTKITQMVFEQGAPTAAQIKRPARVAYEGAMRKAMNDARRDGADPDLHRCDWKVVKEMLKKGYSAAEIADAMLHESPGLLERKGGSDGAQAYVRRTLSKMQFTNPFTSPKRSGGATAAPAAAPSPQPHRGSSPE